MESCMQSIRQHWDNFKQALVQTRGILYKNLMNSISNKKKILGELVMPILISVIYAICEMNKESKDGNLILVVVLTMLLKVYIGMVGLSAIRELVTLFITERTEQFRQYQFISGMSRETHTLANLLYMGLYLSATVLPFYLTLNYFNLDPIYIFYFGAFVISSCCLALFLTSFFTDHKIALELIGMFFSLGSFLIFFYDNTAQNHSLVDYIAMVMPNSAFTIAIIYKNTDAALYSLLGVKVYLLLYSIIQFPDIYRDKFTKFWGRVSNFIPILNRVPNQLMQQLQINQVINSQLQHSTSFNNKQVVIKTEGLSKSYTVNKNTINALNGVNLKIYKSSIFGLLGRNGAGKTTLVDILTKVTQPTSGTFNIQQSTPTIGICYQHEILYQNITVQQHLFIYSLIKPIQFENKQARQQHIDSIIDTLGIEGQRRKKVKELSGGNKRKLSIAIAILGQPDILIFDQPTSGLDPLSRHHVWEILERLRKTESTIILTTHHLDEAERLSDWICVIEKGSVIVENTPEIIKQNYGKGYHLSINYKDQLKLYSYADVHRYKTLIESHKLKPVYLQHIGNTINYLVKPVSKDMRVVQFQQQFGDLLVQMQRDETILLNFHSNTLEESFIAIIDDKDNSGDSLGEQTHLNRQFHQVQTYNCFSTFIFQLWGVFLKNLYFHKSVLLQSLIIYNINIIIILIASYFNTLVKEYLTEQVPESQDARRPGSQNMTMQLMNGYFIMATAFITSPVYDKEKRIRALINTRGLPWTTYWLGTFIFDFAAYNLNLFILSQFVAPKTVAIIGYMTIFKLGIGILLFTYCCSFLFQKVKTASTWFSTLNILFGLIVMPMILFAKQTVFGYLSFTKYLYPYYDIATVVFFSVGQNPQMDQLLKDLKPEGSTIYYNIVFYLLLLVCIEMRVIERVKHLRRRGQEQNSHQNIRMVNIFKNYGSTQALNGVSYQVGEEKMALLGHNGAGKSTTFGLLSAQLNQNQGQLYLEKKHHKSYQTILGGTGICYQDDSLWQGVLVHQILTIFSYIVPIRGTQHQIKWLYDSLEYDSNNHYKRFKNLSGGNKRKLCMMIALWGDPQTRLLDECSTGLDPSSRLAMVETIKSSQRGTTVFTTHSMSQAEKFCSKAVIMGGGRVLQFDLIKRLKEKHFSCCWVQMRTQQSNEQQSKQKIRRQLLCQSIEQISNEGSFLKLQIQKVDVQMSRIFLILQQLKTNGIIESYSFIEPRLQDVYIKVTGQQVQGMQRPNVEIQMVQNIQQ